MQAGSVFILMSIGHMPSAWILIKALIQTSVYKDSLSASLSLYLHSVKRIISQIKSIAIALGINAACTTSNSPVAQLGSNNKSHNSIHNY